LEFPLFINPFRVCVYIYQSTSLLTCSTKKYIYKYQTRVCVYTNKSVSGIPTTKKQQHNDENFNYDYDDSNESLKSNDTINTSLFT